MTAEEPARPAEALLHAAFDLSGQQADVLVDLTAAAATASLTREQAIEAARVLAGKRYAVLHEGKAVRLTGAGTEAAANRRF